MKLILKNWKSNGIRFPVCYTRNVKKIRVSIIQILTIIKNRIKVNKMHTVKFTDWWRGFNPKKDPLFYRLFDNYPLKMDKPFSRKPDFLFSNVPFLAKKTQKSIQRLKKFIIAGNL